MVLFTTKIATKSTKIFCPPLWPAAPQLMRNFCNWRKKVNDIYYFHFFRARSCHDYWKFETVLSHSMLQMLCLQVKCKICILSHFQWITIIYHKFYAQSHTFVENIFCPLMSLVKTNCKPFNKHKKHAKLMQISPWILSQDWLILSFEFLQHTTWQWWNRDGRTSEKQPPSLSKLLLQWWR